MKSEKRGNFNKPRLNLLVIKFLRLVNILFSVHLLNQCSVILELRALLTQPVTLYVLPPLILLLIISIGNHSTHTSKTLQSTPD